MDCPRWVGLESGLGLGLGLGSGLELDAIRIKIRTNVRTGLISKWVLG